VIATGYDNLLFVDFVDKNAEIPVYRPEYGNENGNYFFGISSEQL